MLFFVADDGDEDELWVADPAAGTARMVKDVNPGFFNSYDSVVAGGLFDVDGTLFFIANDGVHGQELWRTDGTAAGTRLVKDIRPGPEGSEPIPMAASGGLLLLSANDGSHGQEPWISDGTEEGTVLLAEVNPGVGDGLRYQTARDAAATPGGDQHGAGPGAVALPQLGSRGGVLGDERTSVPDRPARCPTR